MSTILTEAKQHIAEQQSAKAKRITARDRAEVTYIECRGDRKETMRRFMGQLGLTQNSANTYYYQLKARFGVNDKFELPEGYTPLQIDTPTADVNTQPTTETTATTLPGDAAGFIKGAEEQSTAVAEATEQVQQSEEVPA